MLTDRCKGLLGKGIAVLEFKGIIVSLIEGAGGDPIAA